MSHTTEADYKKQLEELRELHRQAVEETQKVHDQLTLAHNQKDLDDAEIAALKLRTIPVTSFNTPVPRTNLSNAAPKPQIVPPNPSNVASQPNAPQSFNLAASTSPAPSSYLAASTSSLPHVPSINYDYDKSVEVEQRKIINPDTTPVSIRLWLILFDIYSKHPNRLLSITEAFGEKALMALKFMYPDEHVPTDETGFREFLNKHFLTTTNLFADIKAATAKVAMKSILTAPLTLDSLHAYLAAFCTALIPFSEDLLTQASDMDCQKTLIKSFSEGLPKSFRNIVEEASCSTWSSLQKRF